jgi:hypothetical protein
VPPGLELMAQRACGSRARSATTCDVSSAPQTKPQRSPAASAQQVSMAALNGFSHVLFWGGWMPGGVAPSASMSSAFGVAVAGASTAAAVCTAPYDVLTSARACSHVYAGLTQRVSACRQGRRTHRPYRCRAASARAQLLRCLRHQPQTRGPPSQPCLSRTHCKAQMQALQEVEQLPVPCQCLPCCCLCCWLCYRPHY